MTAIGALIIATGKRITGLGVLITAIGVLIIANRAVPCQQARLTGPFEWTVTVSMHAVGPAAIAAEFFVAQARAAHARPPAAPGRPQRVGGLRAFSVASVRRLPLRPVAIGRLPLRRLQRHSCTEDLPPARPPAQPTLATCSQTRNGRDSRRRRCSGTTWSQLVVPLSLVPLSPVPLSLVPLSLDLVDSRRRRCSGTT